MHKATEAKISRQHDFRTHWILHYSN